MIPDNKQNSAQQSLVSIIVPIYNVENYINKCVDSILTQTYHNLEIILVDDGSPDGCPSICDEYGKKDERIVVVHKKNGGLSDARNAGLDVVRGDYITFIDGDDWYAEDTVEMLVDAALQSKVDIICMGAAIVSSDYQRIQPENPQSEVLYSQDYFRRICSGSRTPSVCTKLFSKDIIGTHRFKQGRLNEDFYFVLNLLFVPCKIETIPFVGYYYYQREGSITHSGNKKSVYDAIQNCIDIMRIASSQDGALLSYIASMGIHQASVMVRIIPEQTIDADNVSLNKAVECLQLCRPYIAEANVSFYEKSIARFALMAPVLAARSLRLVRRILR